MQRLAMFLIILASRVVLKNAKNNFFPNLPVGKYKVYPRAIIQCKRLETHIFEFNLYLNKISSNSSEVRGNVTSKKPLDDSFDVYVNFAVKDSIGGWKDNAYFYRFQKACTTFKNLFGRILPMEFVKNASYNGKDCPAPPGVYVSNGFNMKSYIENSNLAQQFFYGTYKIYCQIIDKKNNPVGCAYLIIDIKRPWETE